MAMLLHGGCRANVKISEMDPKIRKFNKNHFFTDFLSMKKQFSREMSRRGVAASVMFWLGIGPAAAWFPAQIDSSKAPKGKFDATDQRLRSAAAVFEKALSAETIVEEENLWTDVIEQCEGINAEWVPDILSRAYGNRGNARSRQGKLSDALNDYDRSINLAPYAVDPVLNRGVAMENLGRFEEATADYKSVLENQPDDPAAWNNLGNVQGALGLWGDALESYGRAVQISPQFSFAAANYALALYEIGRENESIKGLRSILRKYPEFPDVRAALAVTLYAQGLQGDAESNWNRVEDGRYKDINWVRDTRRWPPKLADALDDFLKLH